MNRLHNDRQRNEDREDAGPREREPGRPPHRAQKEQRYFPEGEAHNGRYQSGGYREEVGNYGDADEIQGPNRQARDWQAEEEEKKSGESTPTGGRTGGPDGGKGPQRK